MVITAEANVAVTIDLHCHVDTDTLVVPEGLLVIGVITLDFAFRIESRHHDRWAASLFVREILHLFETIEDNAVVKVFPGSDPTVVGLGFEAETFLKVFCVFLCGLGIYPPREIEDLCVGELAGELIEVYNNVNIIHCDAAEWNDIRKFYVSFFFRCAEYFESGFDIFEVVIVLCYAGTLGVMDFLIRSVNAQVDNFASSKISSARLAILVALLTSDIGIPFS